MSEPTSIFAVDTSHHIPGHHETPTAEQQKVLDPLGAAHCNDRGPIAVQVAENARRARFTAEGRAAHFAGTCDPKLCPFVATVEFQHGPKKS